MHHFLTEKVRLSLPCEQWFLQARSFTAKGEKPLRVTVCFCFSIKYERLMIPWSKRQMISLPLVLHETSGTLRSNDSTATRTSKGLISKTTTLHVYQTFLHMSLPFLLDYNLKMSNFVSHGDYKQAMTKCYFSF